MKCNLENRQSLIAGYLSDNLDEKDAKSFEEHYFQCEICFKELRAAEDALNIIETEGRQVLNLKTGKSIFFRHKAVKSNQKKIYWGIGVSFAIIILAVLLTTILTSDKNNSGKSNAGIIKKNSSSEIAEQESAKKSGQKDITEKEIAANLTGPEFTPNQYLEEWSVENVRSVNDKFDKVISPVPGEKFYGKDISFHWLMNQNESLTLKIITNKEKEIFNKSVDESSRNFKINVPSDIFIHSGLYYWKIEDEDEVLYVGKFYFIK